MTLCQSTAQTEQSIVTANVKYARPSKCQKQRKKMLFKSPWENPPKKWHHHHLFMDIYAQIIYHD